MANMVNGSREDHIVLSFSSQLGTAFIDHRGIYMLVLNSLEQCSGVGGKVDSSTQTARREIEHLAYPYTAATSPPSCIGFSSIIGLGFFFRDPHSSVDLEMILALQLDDSRCARQPRISTKAKQDRLRCLGVVVR